MIPSYFEAILHPLGLPGFDGRGTGSVDVDDETWKWTTKEKHNKERKKQGKISFSNFVLFLHEQVTQVCPIKTINKKKL